MNTECNRFGDIREYDKEVELTRIITNSGDEETSIPNQQITRQSLKTKQDWNSYYIGRIIYDEVCNWGENNSQSLSRCLKLPISGGAYKSK